MRCGEWSDRTYLRTMGCGGGGGNERGKKKHRKKVKRKKKKKGADAKAAKRHIHIACQWPRIAVAFSLDLLVVVVVAAAPCAAQEQRFVTDESAVSRRRRAASLVESQLLLQWRQLGQQPIRMARSFPACTISTKRPWTW